MAGLFKIKGTPADTGIDSIGDNEYAAYTSIQDNHNVIVTEHVAYLLKLGIAAAAAASKSTSESVAPASASWNASYSTVNSSSATWQEPPTKLDTSIYRNTSGIWQDTYSTVMSNSAEWALSGSGGNTDLSSISSLTGGWESTYVTTLANSATWNITGGTSFDYSYISAVIDINTSRTSGSIVPAIDSTYSLGTSGFKWKDLYVSSGSIYVGNSIIDSNKITAWDNSSPVGSIKLHPIGISLPSGWLYANGQSISRTTYAELFAVFGTLYGKGDNSTTFNLPDNNMLSYNFLPAETLPVPRNWFAITSNSSGDIFAAEFNGDIYKQTDGRGNFIAMNQTPKYWKYLTVSKNDDIYADTLNGDIYKLSGGSSMFIGLGQTSRDWTGMTAANGNVYCAAYGGDIYMQTNSTGDFVGLGQPSLGWCGMTTDSNGNVYCAVYGGDIYKQTDGIGNFVAMNQTSRNWYYMTSSPYGDIYAGMNGSGPIYKQTAGQGDFININAANLYVNNTFSCMCFSPNGNMYAPYNGVYVYITKNNYISIIKY